MTSLRVLLLDDDGDGAVARELAEAGIDVVTCGSTFPCVGLTGGICPLDLDGGVDVAVDLGVEPRRHAGVTCALRASVPVLVAAELGPDEDLVGACEDAMADALEPLRAAVADAAAAVLANHGVDDAPLSVHATRRHDRLAVRIAVAAPPSVRGMVATRAAVAVRRFDRTTRSLEVEVVDPVLV